MALDAPYGFASVIGPVVMVAMLLRVSGVTMLDTHLAKTKPGYADYMKRTSPFLPKRPRG